MAYSSSIVFHTVRVVYSYVNRTMWNTIDDRYSILSNSVYVYVISKETIINKCDFVYIYRERVENTNGVFIIDSIPHCPSGLQLCQQDNVEYYR